MVATAVCFNHVAGKTFLGQKVDYGQFYVVTPSVEIPVMTKTCIVRVTLKGSSGPIYYIKLQSVLQQDSIFYAQTFIPIAAAGKIIIPSLMQATSFK